MTMGEIRRDSKIILAWRTPGPSGTTIEKSFDDVRSALAFLAEKQAGGAALVSLRRVETTEVDLTDLVNDHDGLLPTRISNTELVRHLNALSVAITSRMTEIAKGAWSGEYLRQDADLSVVDTIRAFAPEMDRMLLAEEIRRNLLSDDQEAVTDR